MTHSPNSSRGFALLVAVVLTSVLLSVGLALLDITYKQILLSTTAKQSETAFYAADSALECALYWDQQHGSFSYASAASSITCDTTSIPVTSSVSSGVRTSRYAVPCTGGGVSADVTIYKSSSGSSSLYASGYNTCSVTDERRLERGLKATY